jgi:inorganic triphosphatase YgiF
MGQETEIKLRLPPRAAARLRRHPAVAALLNGVARTRRLHSVYFDTPERHLSRARLALRVRRVGRAWIQTLKGEGQLTGATHQRGEWEAAVAECRPELAKIDAPEARGLLDSPEVRSRLAPVFETDFRRTVLPLQFADGGRGELAIDQGKVVAGDLRDPVDELELEMEPASARHAYALLLELSRDFPLEVEVVNKAERGFRLLDQAPPPVVKAGKPRFDAEDSVEQALVAIVSACLYQVQANADGLRVAPGVEYVHQMRVGLRRMRSALSTFAAIVPGELFAPVQDELRWLTGELGPARDWDVFMTETLPPIRETFPDHAGLLRLATTGANLQSRHTAGARAAAESPRFNQLMLALSAWLAARPWREALAADALAALDAPVPTFATAVLSRRHRQFVKRGKSHHLLAPAELHRLRIAGKKLRYAAEFFAGLFAGGRNEAYVGSLQDLQDTLGAINDMAVTRRLLEEIRAETADAGVQEAAGIVAGWGAQKAAHCRGELKKLFKQFRRHQPSWID